MSDHLKLKMRARVQKHDYDCVASSLWIGMRYLDLSISYEDACKRTQTSSEGACSYSFANVFSEEGFETKLWLNRLYKKAVPKRIRSNLALEKKLPSIDQIKKHLTKGHLSVATLDWFQVSEYEEKSVPHMVIVSGFYKNGFYLNNTDQTEPKVYYKIPFKLFEKARKKIGYEHILVKRK